MNLHWLVTAASLIVACLAWRRARLAHERLAQLTQMYWELKYQYGEMRQGLESKGTSTVELASPAPAGLASEAFVPLTSLKR
jgi:hypothetical protein